MVLVLLVPLQQRLSMGMVFMHPKRPRGSGILQTAAKVALKRVLSSRSLQVLSSCLVGFAFLRKVMCSKAHLLQMPHQRRVSKRVKTEEERQGNTIAKKRTRKGGRGRETETGESTRVRLLKTAQRSHAKAMNEVEGE